MDLINDFNVTGLLAARERFFEKIFENDSGIVDYIRSAATYSEKTPNKQRNNPTLRLAPTGSQPSKI